MRVRILSIVVLFAETTDIIRCLHPRLQFGPQCFHHRRPRRSVPRLLIANVFKKTPLPRVHRLRDAQGLFDVRWRPVDAVALLRLLLERWTGPPPAVRIFILF